MSSIEFDLLNDRRLDLIDKKYGFGDFKGRNDGLSEAEERELKALQSECRAFATAGPGQVSVIEQLGEVNLPMLSRMERLKWTPRDD